MSFSYTAFDLPHPPESMQRDTPRLPIVVPCYNEETTLPALFGRLEQLNTDLLAAKLIAQPFELILVDDGSADGTWAAIQNAGGRFAVTGVKLSRKPD